MLWIAAAVLGLVGVLLCVTIVLLPLGVPVLWLARKLFHAAMAMLVPRKVRHPVAAAGDAVRDRTGDARSATSSALEPLGKRVADVAGRGRSFLEHQRKRLA
ncbi:hypothetical protein [Nocardioides panacisoli]|uniref:Uncharacterized protein n=1 Tax=Nocardioides panacisoli TaxID=627624 RepID=A0ABP7I291_9ACTN